MQRAFYLVALVGVLIAVLVTLTRNPEPEPGLQDGTIIETREPDMYGQGISFHQLHEDGSLHYRLNAETIRQYEQDELTRMDIPHLHLRSKEQPPWDIYSQSGFIRKRPGSDGVPEDIVFLREKVRMVQEHPTNGTVTLRSETFYLYPDRQFAETDQDVIIDTEVGRTTAAGMVADLETGVMKLSSNPKQRVHTIVLPEQFKKS